MKIALNGYYGFSSYGDELFNLAAALGAERWWSTHQTSILGPPVAGIRAEFRVPEWVPESLYTSVGFAGKFCRLLFFSNAMLTTDVIVYAGGSTLTSGRTIRKKVEKFALKHGVTKFAAMGVSVGPFADEADQNDTARFLQHFVYLSVRDRQSAEMLRRMEVPVTPVIGRDLAGVLPLLLPGRSADVARDCLGVSLCHFERHFGGDVDLETRRNRALFEGITRFATREHVPVRIFCLNSNPLNGDEALSHELLAHLRSAGVEADLRSARGDLIGCWHDIGACKAFLSVRLHGAVTAYLAGVPFSLIEYHRKCSDFIEDIGQDPALRIRPECVDPSEVERVVRRLFHEAIPPLMTPASYAEDATKNFTEAPWAVGLNRAAATETERS